MTQTTDVQDSVKNLRTSSETTEGFVRYDGETATTMRYSGESDYGKCPICLVLQKPCPTHAPQTTGDERVWDALRDVWATKGPEEALAMKLALDDYLKAPRNLGRSFSEWWASHADRYRAKAREKSA